MRTRSLTEWACSFRMRLARCSFTVPSLVPSRPAICLFRSPSATSSNTWRSRGVSRSNRWRSSEILRDATADLLAFHQSGSHGQEQLVVVERFQEKVGSPGFHSQDAALHVGISGHQDDRQGRPRWFTAC